MGSWTGAVWGVWKCIARTPWSTLIYHTLEHSHMPHMGALSCGTRHIMNASWLFVTRLIVQHVHGGALSQRRRWGRDPCPYGPHVSALGWPWSCMHVACPLAGNAATHCKYTATNLRLHVHGMSPCRQNTATHCNTLHHTATRCAPSQAPHCNTLQHTATNYNATHCSYKLGTWLISSVWHNIFISVTWAIHTCDMTHLYMWHDAFIHMTWHIDTRDLLRDTYTCDMTHSYIWHDTRDTVQGNTK